MYFQSNFTGQNFEIEGPFMDYFKKYHQQYCLILTIHFPISGVALIYKIIYSYILSCIALQGYF